MPRPYREGALRVEGRRLSVRLSVYSVPDPKSRMEGRSNLQIGRKEAHDTGDQPVAPFRSRKVKVTLCDL